MKCEFGNAHTSCKNCAEGGHECFAPISKPPQSHVPSFPESPQIESPMSRIISDIPTQPIKETMWEPCEPVEKARSAPIVLSDDNFSSRSIPPPFSRLPADCESIASSCFELRRKLVPDYQLGAMRSYDNSCFDLKIYSVRSMIIHIRAYAHGSSQFIMDTTRELLQRFHSTIVSHPLVILNVGRGYKP